MRNLKSMDIEMFLSIINMKLRDSTDDLEDICADLDLEGKKVVEYLKENGFILKNRRFERM